MRYFLVLFCILLPLKNAHSVSTSGNASVVIQKLISISETTAMNFGRVYSTASPGDVTLAPAGTRSSSVSTQFDQTATAGVFAVTGEANTTMDVTFTPGTLSNGANTITLDNLSHTPAVATTNASGDLTLNIGGRITTIANQAAGTYSGTYTITVNYQ
ncbi:MAG: DUF4402 domain-containing protein [Alphaproteobacteria bacterium]